MDRTVPDGRPKALIVMDSVVGVPVDIEEYEEITLTLTGVSSTGWCSIQCQFNCTDKDQVLKWLNPKEQIMDIKVKSGLGWQPRVAQVEKTVNGVEFDPGNIR